MKLDNECKTSVGSLGNITFKRGAYAYIGSAQNNLMKRIERHLSNRKNRRWHIDYFPGKISGIYFIDGSRDLEQKIAVDLSGICRYIKNFGASDSKAPSHLFYSETEREIMEKIESVIARRKKLWYYASVCPLS